jgi:nicotinamidase-related amidase
MKCTTPIHPEAAQGRVREPLDAVKDRLGTVPPSLTRARAVSPLLEGSMGLPNPGMTIEPDRTALVLTDLQNDFLTRGGNGWSLLSDSYRKLDTVANLERLLKTAKESGLTVLVSPHYYYPTDHHWSAPGSATEVLMDQISVFQRRGPLTLEGFAGSGADFPEQFKPYLDDDRTVVLSPHKVYGSSTNDMLLQLRKRRIEKVIIAGPAGNLCVEAHFRDLLEQAFEVAVIRDAIGGTMNEEGDGVQAALVNFRFMAHALWTTQEAVRLMREASAPQMPMPAANQPDPAV